jgi:phytoene dehydrogenase-like protein
MKKQLIIELWRETGKQTAGASELELLQHGLFTRFGVPESPASIARTLADHGMTLRHPEILQADQRWRHARMTALFSPEDLNVGTIEAATALIQKIERLRREFDGDDEHLRQSVRGMKSELELMTNPALAQELAQWLTVWLQNPQIFEDWLALRRATADFRERFG